MKTTQRTFLPVNRNGSPIIAVPRVFDESTLPSLRLARSSKIARRVAKLLVIFFFAAVVAMLFVPWQQSVSGNGSVIAFAPEGRQQVVEAAVKGRVIEWDPKEIYEGARVKKGDVVLQIRNIDPEYLNRLKDQRFALKRELEAIRTVVTAYQAQVDAFGTVKTEVVAAADQYIKEAEQKIEERQQKLLAERANESQAAADYKRQKSLFDDGLASELKMQSAERKWKEAQSKVKQAQAAVDGAMSVLKAKKNERSAKEREAQAKIESATAMYQKAQGDVAKLDKMISEIDVKVSQQENQDVKAPRDGFILKMMVTQGGEIVKEGDPLFVLVPDTADRAVEILLSGNDAPLVVPGDHVRLQFEGWPAVQFAGWPSVAVGTFGGRVVSVDATDNGRGSFRILVAPDPEDKDWPSQRFLRQGVRANGWVLLKEVTLGYELWRRINGFPPVVDVSEPTGGKSSLKKKGGAK